MSSDQKPPESVQERDRRLAEDRRRLMEAMRRDIELYRKIVKGSSEGTGKKK
jgi:hypothetical protein